MRYSVREILTAEPVTLERVRERLRTLPDNDDEEQETLLPLITAAREYCENRAGYAFIQQRITAWPEPSELRAGAFYLLRPPVMKSECVKAYGADGAEACLTGWWTDGEEGQMLLPLQSAAGLRNVNPVSVTYVAGACCCPELAQQAMLLLIGHWYQNREATGAATGEIALAVDAILKQYRRWW